MSYWKKKWIWTETDEELQETDEDVTVQVNNEDDSDAGSLESNYQPGGDAESEDGLEYTDKEDATGKEIRSDGKVPKKG